MKAPSLVMFVKICNVLHVSPSYLLFDLLNDSTRQDADRLTELIKLSTPRDQKLISFMIASILECIRSMDK